MKGPDEIRGNIRVTLLATVALALVGEIAERTADQWSVGSLRRALRDVRAACRYAEEARRALAVEMVMDPEERQNLTSTLGMPADSSPEDVMAALVRGGTPPGDEGDGGPPKCPA
jgi:hypothetical protein